MENRANSSPSGFKTSILSAAKFFVFFVLVCQVFASAQPLHALERYSIPLDGTWRFLPRLGDRGEGGRHRYESPEALLGTWREIEVPSCYQQVFEDLEYFEGVTWYSRKFQFEADPETVYAQLVFEGVNYRCRVYLNGTVLGDHEGGYTSFVMPVRDALAQGDNTLTLRVDSRRHLLRLPGDVGWFNYGGIYRPVRLEVFPQVRLSEVAVHTKILGPAAILGVNLKIEGPLAKSPRWAQVQIDVLDKEWTSVTQGTRGFIWTGGQENIYLEVRVNENFVRHWSPESPYLYRLRASLSLEEEPVDRAVVNFGVRTLEVEGRDFLLNGEPYQVRGICYLYDYEKTGRTLDPEVFALDLANFRELGINAIRNHFPLEPRMLDACDSLGFLVWHDVPVYWVRGYDPGDLMLAGNMAREMVMADRNRPCLAIWSLGNENEMPETDRAAFFTALSDEFKRNLPRALTSMATHVGNWENTEKLVDVFSVNIYPGWYNFLGRDSIMWQADSAMLEENLARHAGLLRKNIRSFTPRPVWISEIGAGGAYGMYDNDPWRLFSEDYQAYLLKRQLEMIASIPSITGIFPFLYNDYYDPSRMEAPGQQGKNLKGIVTIDRKRKKAFNVVRDFYKSWGK